MGYGKVLLFPRNKRFYYWSSGTSLTSLTIVAVKQLNTFWLSIMRTLNQIDKFQS